MEIFLFALGLVVGWFTNYYFAVILVRPQLETIGSGSFGPIGYKSFYLSIGNERRHLGVRSPLPFISYRFGKTHIGNRTVARKPAEQCIATLHDKNGRQICNLWWQKPNGEVSDVTNIECGREKQAGIRLFMRADNEEEYFVYQPVSQQDSNPKTTGIPHFNRTKSFIVKISYEYGEQRVEYPVRVVNNYDGTFTMTSPGSTSPL